MPWFYYSLPDQKGNVSPRITWGDMIDHTSNKPWLYTKRWLITEEEAKMRLSSLVMKYPVPESKPSSGNIWQWWWRNKYLPMIRM